MALTVEQQDLIKDIDDRVTSVMLVDGTDKEMMASVFDLMSDIKDLIDCRLSEKISEGEMYYCYERYEGFYTCMKLIERLAQDLQQGEKL
jgi:hypothetical protein